MTVISLPSRIDFDAVFDSPDAKASNRDFLVLAKHREQAINHRIGFVTSKKKIRRAVDRNRFRRIIREYLRYQRFNRCLDIVVIARQIPDRLWSTQYRTQLDQVFAKLFTSLPKLDGE
jgi:ribonuclease P protein component